METGQKAEMQEASISTVFDCIKMQKKLAPLLRSTTPTGDKRAQILRRLSNDLERIASDEGEALEFVGFLNKSRFTRAFGVAPAKFSEAYANINFKQMLDGRYSLLPVTPNTLGNEVVFYWPAHTKENGEKAKTFVTELLDHVNALIAEQGNK
ncbi:MAG: hypothetical protein M1603_00685 [Candidatus Marsarchaeota archaeon]|jgi:hypothetical protein|nr:hypothetical protein [Candidatus Marsarchaeota archaeon]